MARAPTTRASRLEAIAPRGAIRSAHARIHATIAARD
jgi:hypothetical protein